MTKADVLFFMLQSLFETGFAVRLPHGQNVNEKNQANHTHIRPLCISVSFSLSLSTGVTTIVHLTVFVCNLHQDHKPDRECWHLILPVSTPAPPVSVTSQFHSGAGDARLHTRHRFYRSFSLHLFFSKPFFHRLLNLLWPANLYAILPTPSRRGLACLHSQNGYRSQNGGQKKVDAWELSVGWNGISRAQFEKVAHSTTAY